MKELNITVLSMLGIVAQIYFIVSFGFERNLHPFLVSCFMILLILLEANISVWVSKKIEKRNNAHRSR